MLSSSKPQLERPGTRPRAQTRRARCGAARAPLVLAHAGGGGRACFAARWLAGCNSHRCLRHPQAPDEEVVEIEYVSAPLEFEVPGTDAEAAGEAEAMDAEGGAEGAVPAPLSDFQRILQRFGTVEELLGGAAPGGDDEDGSGDEQQGAEDKEGKQGAAGSSDDEQDEQKLRCVLRRGSELCAAPAARASRVRWQRG